MTPVVVRSKRGTQDKASDARLVKLRFQYANGEDGYIEFEKDGYEDIEARSGDTLLISFQTHKSVRVLYGGGGQVGAIVNVNIRQFWTIQPFSELSWVFASVLVVCVVSLFHVLLLTAWKP